MSRADRGVSLSRKVTFLCVLLLFLSGFLPALSPLLVTEEAYAAVGGISGKVTSASEPGGVWYVEVTAYSYDPVSASWKTVKSVITNPSGVYTISGLAPGGYKVEFKPLFTTYYLAEWYNNRADLASADTVAVVGGSTTPNINAFLEKGGKISGKVTSASEPGGVAGIAVQVYDGSMNLVTTAYTAANGKYTTDRGIPAGQYKLLILPPLPSPYLLRWYQDKLDFDSADPVSVTVGVTTGNKNAVLIEGGRITGAVTSASEPGGVEGVLVSAYREHAPDQWAMVKETHTGPGGTYEIQGLEAGDYKVRFYPPAESYYLIEWYDNQADLASADLLAVSEGATNGGVDAFLEVGGKISGRVTGAFHPAGVGGVAAKIYAPPVDPDEVELLSCLTDGDGLYATPTALPPGQYVVSFDPPLDVDPSTPEYEDIYAPQWYDHEPDAASADPVTVGAGATTGDIDAALEIKTCAIQAVAGAGGTINPSGIVMVEQGADQPFTITPEPGYDIVRVKVDGINVGAVDNYTFTGVVTYHTIYATFALKTYHITTTAGPGGSVFPSGDVPVQHGTDATVNINPDPGYQVADVVVDGASVGPVASYTFLGVTADHTLAATFAKPTGPFAEPVPPEPSKTWYLAEGCTAGGMETWVLVQNPNDEPATVNLLFMTELGPQNGPSQVLPPNSRQSWLANNYVESFNLSTTVYADKPVVAERAMYGGDRTWAHDSVGVTEGAQTWYLAEGCTAGDFETWVLVQNPHNEPANVGLTFMTENGRVDGPGLNLPALSRQTWLVNNYVKSYNVSTMVTADKPVVAERAMYGGNRTWATDSVGVTGAATTWYLAEGCTAGGMETWVLVQNPNDEPATVSLSLMTNAGAQAASQLQSVTIPANSRTSFNLGLYVSSYDVSTLVTADRPVVAERAMYGGNRTWAHDSVGYSPE